MSEQEIDLDTAIQLFQLVENFDEYREGLRELLHTCTTNEEVKRAGKSIEEQKQRLRETNPEFNAIIGRREQENKQRAELNRALHKAKMAESKAKASTIIAEAKSSVRGAIPGRGIYDYADRGLDDFVARTRLRKVDPEELERKSEEELWCPICRKKDTSNNMINDRPTCIPCMHRLVPKEELKDYNRDYRRRWKRKRAR